MRWLYGRKKFGLSEMFVGNWDKTEKYNNLSVRMSVVDKALNAREDTEWFLEFVNGFYRELTLVSYKSVKDQNEMGSNIKTKDKLEKCLEGLYHKRNVIVHQSGRRHSDAQREEVTKDMVEKYIEEIEKIVRKMQELARQKG